MTTTSDENKVRYSNIYGYDRLPIRVFNVLGYSISEYVGVKKIDEKLMLWYCENDIQMTVSLHNDPNRITVTDFLNELSRLRNLPNKGKNLFDKN